MLYCLRLNEKKASEKPCSRHNWQKLNRHLKENKRNEVDSFIHFIFMALQCRLRFRWLRKYCMFVSVMIIVCGVHLHIYTWHRRRQKKKYFLLSFRPFISFGSTRRVYCSQRCLTKYKHTFFPKKNGSSADDVRISQVHFFTSLGVMQHLKMVEPSVLFYHFFFNFCAKVNY